MRAVHLACVDAQNRGDRHEELRKLKELQTFLVGARTAPLLRQQVLALEAQLLLLHGTRRRRESDGYTRKNDNGDESRSRARPRVESHPPSHSQTELPPTDTDRVIMPPPPPVPATGWRPPPNLPAAHAPPPAATLASAAPCAAAHATAAAAAPSTPHIVDNDTSDADDGPLLADWALPDSQPLGNGDGDGSVGEELDAQKQAAEDDDEAGMPACSQFSQASQGASGYDDEHKCAVCHDLLYEPVCGPCRHHLCRACFYPAVKVAMCCPLCRAPISLAQGDPPVDRELWEALQQSYPDVVARRRKRMGGQGVGASSAEGTGVPAAAGVAQHEPPAELVRDRIRAQMGTHRRLLTSALPEYCTLLEYELARPIHEIARCKCPERFVMVRRQVRREGGNRGREYQSCPLSRPTSQQRGTGQESRFGCGAFQWVV